MIWICVIGYIISTLLCLGSLYVFRHFTWVSLYFWLRLICIYNEELKIKINIFWRKLWCLRNLIHANFIACIATHNLCWLVLALSLTLGLELCLLTELLVEITKFCVTSTFCWMLVEGGYLYLSEFSVISMTLMLPFFLGILYCLHAHRMKYWMCASVGWGLPFALSTRSLWHKLTSDRSQGAHSCLDINESLDNLTVTVIIVIIFVSFYLGF
jgi:hypothetical protein